MQLTFLARDATRSTSRRAIKYIFIMSMRVLMRIFVVNNYGQFNHLIVRSIRDLVECKLISNQTPPEEIEADGLILGGGPALERAGRCADYLKELDIPVLGRCLGLECLAFSNNPRTFRHVPGSVRRQG
jgi:hypothetical protein